MDSALNTLDHQQQLPMNENVTPAQTRERSHRFTPAARQAWSGPSEALRIVVDMVYRNYDDSQPDPAIALRKASEWSDECRKLAIGREEELVRSLMDTAVKTIYGSNVIEYAGLGIELTTHYCREVLTGQYVDTDEEAAVSWCRERQSNLRDKSVAEITHARRETIQHAQAFQYSIDEFAIKKNDMSEELIKTTHAILTRGLTIVGGEAGREYTVQSSEYAGIYRNVFIGAGDTRFVVPRFVPKKMRELCEDLKTEISKAESTKHIDPFSLASRFSMDFVQIHPFQDGNGRTCRLILNAILFRYTGMFCPFGEHGEDDRRVYIGIKRRAGQQMTDHGEYATYVVEKTAKRLRQMKKKLRGKKNMPSQGPGN